MDSFISGIIDYVARPSTTDSPVRVVRKSKSESETPNCVSVDSDVESFEIMENLHTNQSDVEPSDLAFIACPAHARVGSSSLLARFNVPDVVHNSSVLTAEGIITCGDLACFNRDEGDRAITHAEEPTPSIEIPVVKQFETAFAHFLYKNPAFSSMSYMTLQKLRSKLLKESAKNIKVEDELRKQLSALREAKREREVELQRELLIVTKAKAAREAELQSYIERTRKASTLVESMILAETLTSSAPSVSNSPTSVFLADYMSTSSPPRNFSATPGSVSFEEFNREIQKNKMEQAHVRAEMEKLKKMIAEESVNTTFGGCFAALSPEKNEN